MQNAGEFLFGTEPGIRRLETELLPAWMVKQRWFAGKQRGQSRFRIVRHSHLGPARVLAVEVSYERGEPETYAVPLLEVPDAGPHGEALRDAVFDPDFRQALFQLLKGESPAGDFRVETGRAFSRIILAEDNPASRVISAEQSNTSLVFGERLFVKLYRRLSPGIHPDFELIRFLGDRGFENVPGFAATIDWDGQSFALATECIQHEGNAWETALSAFEQCRRESQAAAAWQNRLRRLGELTGQMHLALASEPSDPAFAPEPFSRQDADSLASSITWLGREMAGLLENHLPALSDQARNMAVQVLSRLPDRIAVGAGQADGVLKIRTHGDYHLGQVLDTGSDFVIIDFEGEPSRSLAERRSKHPPIRDVAGLLRSLHYAAHVARLNSPGASVEESENWARQSRETFLAAWRGALAGSVLESGARGDLLRLYLREKAVYEVIYELNSRPDWVLIPLLGLLQGD